MMRPRKRMTVALAAILTAGAIGGGAVVVANAAPPSPTPTVVDTPEPGDTPDVPGEVDVPEPGDAPDVPGVPDLPEPGDTPDVTTPSPPPR